MRRKAIIVVHVDGKVLFAAVLAAAVLFGFAAFSEGPWAQKLQEDYKDKLDIADSQGGVAVATSADGKHVYVAGPQGVNVSEDFGETGTWAQTVRLK